MHQGHWLRHCHQLHPLRNGSAPIKRRRSGCVLCTCRAAVALGRPRLVPFEAGRLVDAQTLGLPSSPVPLLPLFLTCDCRRAPGSGLSLLQPQGFGCHLYSPILQFSLDFPKFPWSIPLGCLEASESKRVKATPDSLPSPVCLFLPLPHAPAQLAGTHFTPPSARTPESFLTA